jgi:hypothetical protein
MRWDKRVGHIQLIVSDSARSVPAYKIRYGGLQLDAEPVRGNRKYEQVNNLNGRPVRARTADLHRVKVAL